MEYLLEVQHLNKNLNTFALHDISFTLKPGFITGLIGQNGCGKTSLIKTILNLYEKDSGAVFVTGHSMENEEIAAKDQLGVVLDECLFDADTRVETNARCFGALYSQYDHRLFLEFCRRFDVDPKKKIGKLSKGQKARFQLAFAFSHDAKVFLMDEPAAGLDPDGIYAGNRGGRHEKHSFFHPYHRRSGSDRRLHSSDGLRTSDTGFNAGRTCRSLSPFTWYKRTTGAVRFSNGRLSKFR